MDPTRSESAAQQAAAINAEISVQQTLTQIQIQTRQGGADRTIRYNTNGTDTKTQLGEDNAIGHMKWDGDRLVTDTIYNVSKTALGQSAIYSVSADGREMTVEYGLRVLHGYEDNHQDAGKKDPNYSTGKDVFVRP